MELRENESAANLEVGQSQPTPNQAQHVGERMLNHLVDHVASLTAYIKVRSGGSMADLSEREKNFVETTGWKVPGRGVSGK